MRILALDWGTVRIGAAITDEEGRIAFPLDKPLDGADPIGEVRQLVVERAVGKILLGLPLNLKGEEAGSAEKVRTFARKLNEETGLSVELVDERMTSVAAGNLLGEQGLAEKRQREIKDNVAAQLMLQQYIDSRKKEKN